MATTRASLSASNTNTVVVSKADSNKTLRSSFLNHPWRRVMNHQYGGGHMCVKTMAAPDLSKKVEESITNAKEVCAEDPVSGECAAAWDEVEEVSAAASDERLKKKKTDTDPLETYCNDNPETDECRTYED